MSDDMSLTGLAQANLSEVPGCEGTVKAATAPLSTKDLLVMLAGYQQVQAVSTDAGQILLIGWRSTGEMDVFNLCDQAHPVHLESSSN